MSTVRARVVADLAELEQHEDAWDALAVACGRPLSAPAWLLAWWRSMAPSGAVARVIVVRDDTGLIIGVAPFYARHRRALAEYRLMGSGMANRNAPLAMPGREREVAGAIAGTLARIRPRPARVRLDQIDRDSAWPTMLAEAWPGRPAHVSWDESAPAPTLDLGEGDIDRWLEGKSANFRQRLRRDSRRLEARGARIRHVVDAGDLRRVMHAFGRLHGARWGERSQLADGGGEALMLDAGRRLVGSGRFRAVVIETNDLVVSVQLFVAAGGEVAYWNGGWDPEWAPLSPAIQGIVAGIEDAMRRGDRRIDFGQGDHHYKRRLADGDAPISWAVLSPPGVVGRAVRVGAAARRVGGGARRAARDAVARLTSRVQRGPGEA